MFLKRMLLLFVFASANILCGGLYAAGQDNKHTAEQQDSSSVNIVDLSGKLGLHFYGIRKFTKINFYNRTDDQFLIYSPNSQLNIGIGFNYKWMGLGVAFNFRFINNDDWKYGKTSRLDMNMNLYGKKSVIDVTFFLYESFYLENPSDVFKIWTKDSPYYIRPDMRFASVGLSYTYIFNNQRFSYKAAFVSNALQLKSAGSFFLGGQILFSEIAGDSSFFPPNTSFARFPHVVDVGSSNLGLTFGYAYNYIFKRSFYLSGSLALSPSVGSVNYLVEGDSLKTTTPAVAMPIIPRLAFGFNTEKYYAGFSISAGISGFNSLLQKELSLSYGYGKIRIFVGRHFDVKKKKARKRRRKKM